MALNKFAVKTKTSKTGYIKKQPQIRNGLLTFSAAFLGVIIGITAVLAVALPMINSEFAMQTKQLSQRLVSMVPADAVVSACVQPTSSTSSGGEILGASTSAITTPSMPVSPATAPASSTTFVSELVSGVLAHTTATISDTGPQSSNSIATTNTNTTTVTNTNDINVSSNNNQTANSGNATTNNNTTGGSATSGNVANSNSNSPTIDINN